MGTSESDYFDIGIDGATISANEGNDTINNHGDSVTIDGGAGNDTISNYGSNVTIDAGKGNDSISNRGENVLIKYSGGDDLITGFNSTSTLEIVSGTLSSVTTNGTDYFLRTSVHKRLSKV